MGPLLLQKSLHWRYSTNCCILPCLYLQFFSESGSVVEAAFLETTSMKFASAIFEMRQGRCWIMLDHRRDLHAGHQSQARLKRRRSISEKSWYLIAAWMKSCRQNSSRVVPSDYKVCPGAVYWCEITACAQIGWSAEPVPDIWTHQSHLDTSRQWMFYENLLAGPRNDEGIRNKASTAEQGLQFFTDDGDRSQYSGFTHRSTECSPAPPLNGWMVEVPPFVSSGPLGMCLQTRAGELLWRVTCKRWVVLPRACLFVEACIPGSWRALLAF